MFLFKLANRLNDWQVKVAVVLLICLIVCLFIKLFINKVRKISILLSVVFLGVFFYGLFTLNLGFNISTVTYLVILIILGIFAKINQ